METLVALLKPLFVPLLKLKLEAPHLPEGSSLVRELRPSEQWLGYRYLASLAGLLYQFVMVGAGCVAIVISLQGVGVALAVLAALVEFFVIGFSLVTIRIDYELRHYLIGDRSLRVAHGAWKREEVTLSYANIQNLEVTQGPLERLFGYKNLTISTAGAEAAQPGQPNSHQVSLVGLPDADELRGLILKMLEKHRDSGLGDAAPRAPTSPAPSTAALEEVKAAALELRAAARAFRGS